ncbi:MAG: anti-sigma B factor antagonist [Saprospiraceae bacterium]|jgi:anti-sigma B factor antagonist
MEIAIIDSGDAKVISFIGNLDTNTSPDAETQLTSLINEGVLKIVINLEQLDYISSAGLRVLLSTTKSIKSKGGGCHMCNLNEMVQEVFDISGFSMIFSVYQSSEAAVEGFN